MIIPEVLAPAGNLEKLKVAVDYGANAVYLGGLKFGLRSAADNFTYEELREGVEYAHAKDALVYVVLNGFLHDQDLEELKDFVEYLDALNVDAVIVSDLGVIKTVQRYSSINVHLSTQASCLNSYSAKLWKNMGVTRIVLGREVSIEEARNIKENVDIEIEMFIHGSMCMAYSGNCVISNFTQGRDSNRGGCAHSCRFEYSIQTNNKQDKKKSYFMSSKDLNGLSVLENFIHAGIDSVKIEGRMKSHLYTATMSKVYRQALDYYREHGNFLSEQMYEWEQELAKVTHRSYAPANLIDKADSTTIYNEREFNSQDQYVIAGNVVDTINNEFLVIHVKSSFSVGDQLELLSYKDEAKRIPIKKMYNLNGKEVMKTNPSTLVKVSSSFVGDKNSVLRMRVSK